MKHRKTEAIQGITLISLTITVVVLMILAGIGIYSGKGILEKAKLEELKTNMLLIQAKAREYVEEVSFKMGIGSEAERTEKRNTARQEIYVESEKLKKAEEIPEKLGIAENERDNCYYLTVETKQKWGLDNLKNEEQYLLKFDEMNLSNVSVEVYYLEGYGGKYALAEIDKIQE